MGAARMDNNTLLFHDKGAGVFKGISIYPNRIEAVVKNNFFGTLHLQPQQPREGSGIRQRAQYGDVTGRF